MKRSGLKRKTGLKPGRPVPGTRKPSRPRKGSEPAYLAFVRRQPCAACGAPPPSHPHHREGERAPGGPKGGGMKAPDETVVPLCKSNPVTGWLGCHQRWHDHGHFFGLSRENSIALMIRTRLELRQQYTKG